MDRSAALTPAVPGTGTTAPKSCPRCLEPLGPLPAVHAPVLDAQVRRCVRCGTRVTRAEDGGLLCLFTCEGCGVPFAAAELLAHGDQRCGDCRVGRVPPELPDRSVTAAIEYELREAIRERERFVDGAAARTYLERVTLEVASHLEDRPERPAVALIDDGAVRTLALPSGLVVLSTGTLASLRDEAELAFVIGHELAHAAAADAAIRLVRLGYPGNEGAGSGARAARELEVLGYGRRRERDADRRAIDAMQSRGWDPASAMRWLSRLDVRAAHGADEVASIATAHPAFHDRVRHLERATYGAPVPPEGYRVNREVFERVLGERALQGALYPATLGSLTDVDMDPAPSGGVPLSLKILVVLGGVIGIASLVALLTTR